MFVESCGCLKKSTAVINFESGKIFNGISIVFNGLIALISKKKLKILTQQIVIFVGMYNVQTYFCM